jgi:hypothetical protein
VKRINSQDQRAKEGKMKNARGRTGQGRAKA